MEFRHDLFGFAGDCVSAECRSYRSRVSLHIQHGIEHMPHQTESGVAQIVADMGDFAAMNEVYAQFFRAPFPARSAVAVRTLPKGALVEIECIAVK